MNKQFWKMFAVLFVVAFAANVGVAVLFERLIGSPWKWDTTTGTAAVVAFIIAFVVRRQQKKGRMNPQ